MIHDLWNRISESGQPKNAGIYMTFRPGGDGYRSNIGMAFWDSKNWLSSEYQGPHPVTHWQPQPKPPNGGA